MNPVRVALALLAVLSGACSGSDASAGLCDPGALTSALAAAQPGDLVQVGRCEVTAELTVPAGVTLVGFGEASVIRAPRDGIAVTLVPGAGATTLSSLVVVAAGRMGVLARGPGMASLRDVTVRGERGVAVAASDVTNLHLDHVHLEGLVTTENAATDAFTRVVSVAPPAAACPVPGSCECDPGMVDADAPGDRACDSTGRWATVTATYGILAIRSTLELAEVDVRGFASFGVMARDGRLVWRRGSIYNNLGVGIHVLGGSADLLGVDVRHTLQGLRGEAPYGVVASDGAVLTGNRLLVSDNDRYGLVMLGANGAQTDLTASDNGDAAVWVGESTGFTLDGAMSAFSGNAFAGVVVADSSNVAIDGAGISGTRSSRRVVGMFGAVELGDGLHLVRALDAVSIRNVTLSNNARTGLLVDLTSGADRVTFDAVSVSSTGTGLGAIGGVADGDGRITPMALGTWDRGIARSGAAATNDPAFTAVLDGLPAARPGPVPTGDNGVIAPML